MTVAADSVLRVVASMLWTDGNINQNIYNAKVSGGGAPWDNQDIVDDAEAWMDNIYLNMTGSVSDQLDGNEIIVYKYDVVGADWDEVSSQSWGWNPTSADHQLPRGVAALLRLWTTDPDVQGKKYIPGTVEADVTDGLYNAATLTPLLAMAADWYTPFTGASSGATWTPGIWSVAGSLFVAGINHIAANAIPAYQRRRKRNVGI